MLVGKKKIIIMNLIDTPQHCLPGNTDVFHACGSHLVTSTAINGKHTAIHKVAYL